VCVCRVTALQPGRAAYWQWLSHRMTCTQQVCFFCGLQEGCGRAGVVAVFMCCSAALRWPDTSDFLGLHECRWKPR
jgi:hypothetical protein